MSRSPLTPVPTMVGSRIHRIWIDEKRRNGPAEVEFVPAPEVMNATV